MADYQILMDFQEGNGLVDYTSSVSGESFTREQVVGYEDSHEISTLTMTFKPSDALFEKFWLTVKVIKVKVYKDTLPFFTGIIRPNADYTINEKIQPISVEVLDNSYLVDKKVPVQKLYPQGDISAVDRIKSLLADIGISSSNYDVSSIPTDAKINFLLVEEEENYKDILDNICFECGYSYYFDESGKFILKNIAPDEPYPSIWIENEDLLQPFTMSKVEKEYDGVKVIAPKISFHSNQLVFRGIKDGGSKIPVSYGLYYPENANNVDVFQKYSVVSGAKEDKFLYASANKVLDATFDEDISIEKQELSSTQAQVYFKNNSIDTTRYIQKFDIRADIYKNSGEVESVVSGTNPQEYKTKYISSLDTSTVDRLANILHGRQTYFNYTYEFSSRNSYPVGGVAYFYLRPSISYNGKVLITSKVVKDGDPIIYYKAVMCGNYGSSSIPIVATSRMIANSSVEGTLDTEARIADTETTVSTLSTTVSSQGVAIASQANQITALGTQLSALEGVGDGWADFSQMVSDNATAVSDLTTRVTTAEGNITTAQTTAGNALSIANTNTTGLASVVTDVSTIETTLSDEVSKSTELKNRVDAIIDTEFPSRDLAISNINGTITTTIIPRITSTETGLSSLAGRVTTTEGSITTHATEISQNADDISSVATRVSSAEGTITSHTTSITQNATGISAVASRVTTAEGTITSQGTTISSHTTSITQNADDISSVATRVSSAEGTITTQGSLITQNADDISAVVSRVDTAEGTISSHTTAITQNADAITAVAGRTTTAEGTISTHTTQIAQNADEISSLASRTTTVEGTVSSQATLITQNADDITALATRTTTAEGTITTHTSQISQNAEGLSSVVTRVGTAENLITQNATSIIQNADDIELKVGAVDTNGNEVVGAKLKIGTIDSSSYIRLDADEILIDGSVKAGKIDTNDLFAKELIIKEGGSIKSLDGRVSITAGGSITAQDATLINATITGTGTFSGDITNPIFRIEKGYLGASYTFPSPIGWDSYKVYNAMTNVPEVDTTTFTSVDDYNKGLSTAVTCNGTWGSRTIIKAVKYNGHGSKGMFAYDGLKLWFSDGTYEVLGYSGSEHEYAYTEDFSITTPNVYNAVFEYRSNKDLLALFADKPKGVEIGASGTMTVYQRTSYVKYGPAETKTVISIIPYDNYLRIKFYGGTYKDYSANVTYSGYSTYYNNWTKDSGNITLIGKYDIVEATTITPKTSTTDIGAETNKFRDGWFSGRVWGAVFN